MPTFPSIMLAGPWLLAIFLQIPPPPKDAPRPSDLRARREAILSTERSKLQTLADRLQGEGKPLDADRAGPEPEDSPPPDGSSRFILLAEVVPARPKEEPSAEKWRADREQIRAETAKALLELARVAARPPESFALADDCLRGVLARQPDHPEARRLLGFIPHQGGWATPFAVDMIARKFVADPTYGWVPADWVPHLKAGELPGKGAKSWLPTLEADDLRRDWPTGWDIATEHFKIHTNAPLNDAISFGRKLEDLHQLFFALMADVIDPDRLPLAQRFRKPDARPTLSASKNAHQVSYFANRDDYARFLELYLGADAKTNLGTYIPRRESKSFGGKSYFFNDPGGQLDGSATLYHEGSHQLLFESAGPDDYVRNLGQFWAFEGLGTYFETLQHEPDGSLRIGGLVGPRIAEARKRLIRDGNFLPIERLVGLSKIRFYERDSIYRNYAEAMAVTVFLMQVDEGRHREAFLDYFRDVYKGRFRNDFGQTLGQRLGVDYPTLDRQFLDYLGREIKP